MEKKNRIEFLLNYNHNINNNLFLNPNFIHNTNNKNINYNFYNENNYYPTYEIKENYLSIPNHNQTFDMYISNSPHPLVESKKRGRPKKIRPNECFICKSKSTSEWRTIIGPNSQKEYVCNACGLRERKLNPNKKKPNTIDQTL
ncbi:hypothetical protein DICPUDRAFT_82915 [Dictyostelium purpureum]|uniref:GATA-type domain-containing protein n=1 Tax=Dictyostelium purpureum TaxID=5786 RepID=F0ZY04_DICPU|nr:uncharacterized protein DICPUDRAFT_82915 [Dictyostelium purpureum]EGC31180.1 hypothetical protein DICPUDRAFT_82915 [Dictyostelium purpureum]|eukprot:XP_003292300.1 hypothetical protein DICPUDRAFT_82915 [Dictyostelium purpureum]